MRFWQALAFLPTEDLVEIAETSEAAGYYGATLSDHVFYPREMQSAYPYSPDGNVMWTPETPWPDPWIAIAALAAATTQLRFTTNVYVAAARDVFTVANSVATAAAFSEERVALGASAGWCREEFDAAGIDFESRGRRLDEMIEALRLLWSGEWAEFRGEHVRFDKVKISPVPHEPIPIYTGGESAPALRRAARLADGWIANGLTPEAAELKIAELQRLRKDAGRESEFFEIIVPLMTRPDLDVYRRMEDLGVTGLIVAPWLAVKDDGDGMLLEKRVAAIERFAEKIIAEY